MKKLLFVLFTTLLLVLTPNITTTTNSTSIQDELSFTFSFETPHISNINQYDQTVSQVTIPDCQLYAKPGKPKLPVKPVQILLPKDSTVESIKVTTSSPVQLNQKVSSIELGQIYYPLTQPPENNTPTINYDTNHAYPKQHYNNIGVQHFRGYAILVLNLHPATFNASTNTISYYPEMTIEITTSQNNKNHTLYRGMPSDFDAINKKINAIDYKALQSYKTPKSINSQSSQENQYDYVLITTKEFKEYDGNYDFNTLLAKREEQGLKTTIKTINEIYEECPGEDLPEKIRNFITYAYQNWNTEWILLGGDVEFVPVRYLYDVDGGDMILASDTYYQCLDGDFNYDNDSWYGEKNDGVNGSKIDLYAEVFIGRASVDNTEQIESFVKKTLTYESSQWGMDSYLYNVESVGEKVWSGGGGWGAGYVERCIGYWTDYNLDTRGISPSLYTINRRYERDTHYMKRDLEEDIHTGVNIINHLGHSSPTYCMGFTPSDIFDFTNQDYGFWYSQGCHPGQFDVVDECVAEAWTVAEHGGFAAIMNTGFGYGSNHDYDGPDNRFAREFYDALNYTEEKISRIGKANQDSKEDNLWQIDTNNAMYHNYYSTTLFGDPYVQLKGMEDFRADFSWNQTFPTPSDPIQFNDHSLSALTYYWDFDDGTTSQEKNPTHNFDQQGTYDVTLTITGEMNKVDEITREVSVFENWPPFAISVPQNIATDSNTIQFQAENSWDPDGTVISYHWDFDDGNVSDKINPVHQFSKDGIYEITLTVTDDLGKTGSSTFDIRIDQHTPPDSDVIVGGKRGTNNWLVSSAYVSIETMDYSEIKRIKYKLDEEDWETYENPIIVENNGLHTIQYYAIDTWGNQEQTKTKTFGIDTTPPKLQTNIDGSMTDGWYTSPVTVFCEANDTVSDIKVVYYKIKDDTNLWQKYTEPLMLTANGKQQISFYAENNAGLTSEKNKTLTIPIDTKPPTTTVFVKGDPSKNSELTITFTASDKGSGVKDIFYSFDNESFTQYTNPITVKETGTHTIYYYSTDSLSHEEPIQKKTFTHGVEPELRILNPKPGIYIKNDQILVLNNQIIAFGPITFKTSVNPQFLFIDSFSIYIDGALQKTLNSAPYDYEWTSPAFGRKNIRFELTSNELTIQKQITLFKIG